MPYLPRMCVVCGRDADLGPCMEPNEDGLQPCTFDPTYDELLAIIKKRDERITELESQMASCEPECHDLIY